MWISLEITPNYSNSHDGNKTQKVIKISSSFKSNKWKTSGDKTKQTWPAHILDSSHELSKVSTEITQRGLKNCGALPLSRREQETNDRSD